jgi:putative heme iron utilization protein
VQVARLLVGIVRDAGLHTKTRRSEWRLRRYRVCSKRISVNAGELYGHTGSARKRSTQEVEAERKSCAELAWAAVEQRRTASCSLPEHPMHTVLRNSTRRHEHPEQCGPRRSAIVPTGPA